MTDHKFQETKRQSNLSGKMHQYLLIDELPSHFRSYKGVKEVYVRGLFFEESENLAKYVGDTAQDEVSYKILKNIYADVIQGIDVGELEIPDFQVLMIISSIWTVRGFGWVPNIPCPQKVPNKLINSLKADIDKLQAENELEPIEDYDKQLKTLQDDLDIQPKIVKCDGVIQRKIELDDLETYDEYTDTLPATVKINDEDTLLGALTVDDFIAMEDLTKDTNYNSIYLSYALMIKNEDMSLEDKYKTIRFSEQSEIHQIKELDDKLFIKIKPVSKQCPKCYHNAKVYIGLDKLKAYP